MALFLRKSYQCYAFAIKGYRNGCRRDAKSDKYAAVIQSDAENLELRAWSSTIPDSYDGKEITLSGWIKTENVSGGYAGLWMRIDPSVAFDNMNANGIKGTADWE